MKRPSFQFYPADWRNDSKLRYCSEAARGAWMDLLCLLHDADEYGVLRWHLAKIASTAGVRLRLAKELAEAGVFKGADENVPAFIFTPRHAGKNGDPVILIPACEGPCWYSSRFVRDEWVRLQRGKGSRFDESNQPPKQEPKTQPKASPKPPIGDAAGDGSTASSASSSSASPESVFALSGVLEGHEDPQPGLLDPRQLVRALESAGVPDCFAYDENLIAYIAEGGTQEHLLAVAQLPRLRNKSFGYVVAAARGKLAEQAAVIPAGVTHGSDRKLSAPEQARAAQASRTGFEPEYGEFVDEARLIR